MGDAESTAGRSIWTYLAPAALLAAITIFVLIADGAGWFGRGATSSPTPAAPAVTVTTTPLPSGPVETTATVETATTSTTDTTATTETSPTTETTATGTAIKVTVKAGDTLNAIAARTNTTVARLLELNPGVDPQTLSIGQELIVG